MDEFMDNASPGACIDKRYNFCMLVHAKRSEIILSKEPSVIPQQAVICIFSVRKVMHVIVLCLVSQCLCIHNVYHLLLVIHPIRNGVS